MVVLMLSMGDFIVAQRAGDRVEKRVEKSAGRRPLSMNVREARTYLRDMIINQLEVGPRGVGPDRRWTKSEFVEALGASSDTAKDWFRSEDPAPPRRYARKILDLFFGEKMEHAEQRAALRAALLAAGIEHDELDNSAQIDLHVMRSSQHPSGRPELTRFSIYQPERANEFPRLIVPFEFGVRRDRTKRVPLKGQRDTKVALDIGLTAVRFAIESECYRPAQDSIFGPAGPKSQVPGLVVQRGGPAGTLDIKAKEPGTIVEGDPFDGIYTIHLEPKSPDIEGTATFIVKTPQEAVEISVPGGSKLGEDKKTDLLRILFGKLVDRDANDWFVLEREDVIPSPKKDVLE